MARGAVTIPAPLVDPPTVLGVVDGEEVVVVVVPDVREEVVAVVVGATVVVVVVEDEVEAEVVVVPLDVDAVEEEDEDEELPVVPERQLSVVPGWITSGPLKALTPVLSVILNVTLVPVVMLTIQVIEVAEVSAN